MAWNEAVVTTAGMELLAKCLSDSKLVITRALGGESCSAATSLLAIKNIEEPFHELNLFKIENDEGKIIVNLRVQNKGLEAEYTLRQIGLYARLEDDSDSEVLFAVIQDSTGEVIPSEGDNPDFLIEFDFVIPVGNAENIMLEVTPNTFATVEDLQETDRAISSHAEDKENPHNVTKEQVGLGNVPNLSTNDQAPTYTTAEKITELSSGEKLTVALGKIARAVKFLIEHVGDNVRHITKEERNTWNSKAAGDHTHLTATHSAKGFMSADDKKKLDGVEAEANAYNHPTTSGSKHIPAGGTSGQILKWSADGTAVWGEDTKYTAATANPKANGTAAVGSSEKYAREDHVHPLQTSVAKLTTARTINGVEFDGTKNISISQISAKSVSGEVDLNDLRTTTGIGIWNIDSANQTVLNKPTNGEARGTLIDINYSAGYWGTQYFFHYNTNRAYTRNYNLGSGSKVAFGAWRQLAADNGSCLSAVKLDTARNISIGGVSKSFDGSSDISFDLNEIPTASTSAAGFMSADDKKKINNTMSINSVVQGTISGLTAINGTYYVLNNSKATKALVEVWGSISISSATANASVYGSRYISSIKNGMTAINPSLVFSGPSASVQIGVDSTGRPYFSGSIGANFNYRVTWYL